MKLHKHSAVFGWKSCYCKVTCQLVLSHFKNQKPDKRYLGRFCVFCSIGSFYRITKMWIWHNGSTLMHEPRCTEPPPLQSDERADSSAEAGRNQADNKGRAGARSSRCGGQNTGRVEPGRTGSGSQMNRAAESGSSVGGVQLASLGSFHLNSSPGRLIGAPGL